MAAVSDDAGTAGGLIASGHAENAEAGAQREKLKRWFWCAVFGQAYESSPNSQVRQGCRGADRLGWGRCLAGIR